MIVKKQQFTKKRKIILVISVFLLIVVAVFTFLFWKNNLTDKLVETTSKEPSAQSSFTNGGQKIYTQSTKNEGVITDNNGDVSSVPPVSVWSSSASGIITVYSPAKNSILSTGQTLSGESTADRVSFRLTDSVSGVIAHGSISVVNSKFSGTFSFETNASDGRLDIFTVDGTGKESNSVEIPVRYKQ